jgi:hypothetical protein
MDNEDYDNMIEDLENIENLDLDLNVESNSKSKSKPKPKPKPKSKSKPKSRSKYESDSESDLDEPLRVKRAKTLLLPTDPNAAELSDRIFGNSETGPAYGNIYTRNLPIEYLNKTQRSGIIAKGNASGANYVGDYDANNLTNYNNAWRDAEDVLNEEKQQKQQAAQTKKRKRVGGKTNIKSKKQRKQRKNKSSRRNQKK